MAEWPPRLMWREWALIFLSATKMSPKVLCKADITSSPLHRAYTWLVYDLEHTHIQYMDFHSGSWCSAVECELSESGYVSAWLQSINSTNFLCSSSTSKYFRTAQRTASQSLRVAPYYLSPVSRDYGAKFRQPTRRKRRGIRGRARFLR